MHNNRTFPVTNYGPDTLSPFSNRPMLRFIFPKAHPVSGNACNCRGRVKASSLHPFQTTAHCLRCHLSSKLRSCRAVSLWEPALDLSRLALPVRRKIQSIKYVCSRLMVNRLFPCCVRLRYHSIALPHECEAWLIYENQYLDLAARGPRHYHKPSSPALQSFISRPHSDFKTCDAVIRRCGLGSKME